MPCIIRAGALPADDRLWAEADLISVPRQRAGQAGALSCARMAFEALPDTVTERYFRGDSACYGRICCSGSVDRHSEPGGRIGFAVSCRCGVGQSIRPTFKEEADGTVWAEVDLVSEHKSRPLRYVFLKLQGSLFACTITRWRPIWNGTDWITVGTVLKNALAGGHMRRFANAAWLKLSILSYNTPARPRGSRGTPCTWPGGDRNNCMVLTAVRVRAAIARMPSAVQTGRPPPRPVDARSPHARCLLVGISPGPRAGAGSTVRSAGCRPSRAAAVCPGLRHPPVPCCAPSHNPLAISP